MDRTRIKLRKFNRVNRRHAARLLILFVVAWAPLLSIAGSSETSRVRDDAIVALGRQLFGDTRLSSTRAVSCATCHVPAKAFSDGVALAIGVNGERGTRNTPSLWNAVTLPSLFWDGRRKTLEEEALDPLLNPKEHGLADEKSLLAVLRADLAYRSAFRSAFGVSSDDIRPSQVSQALAAFQRTLISNDSALDVHFAAPQRSTLSAAANRGLALFQGRAGCADCHTVADHDRSFTDHRFHGLGISLGNLLPRLAELTQRVVGADARKLDRLITQDSDIAALGRFVLTKDPRDIGKFRTPSLRNVALTAPYMHDGSVATLEDAIDYEIYYRTLERNQPLILTPLEKADLLELLLSLTSSGATAYPDHRD